MKLKDFIERGIKKAGSQATLGEYIGVSSLQLTNAKGDRAGLPVAACCLLAELINEDATTVIAASELVTEKKQDRRAFWEKKLEKVAACILAVVILNMSPTPSEAAPMLQVTDSSMYIMSNIRRRLRALKRCFSQCFQVAPLCPEIARVHHVTA